MDREQIVRELRDQADRYNSAADILEASGIRVKRTYTRHSVIDPRKAAWDRLTPRQKVIRINRMNAARLAKK